MADSEEHDIDVWHGSRGLLTLVVVLALVVLGLVLVGEAQGSLG